MAFTVTRDEFVIPMGNAVMVFGDAHSDDTSGSINTGLSRIDACWFQSMSAGSEDWDAAISASSTGIIDVTGCAASEWVKWFTVGRE